jgi:DNA repair exonuclease SbcCD ATPase subunit
MNKYTFNKAKEDYEKASSEYISARTEGSYNSCWRSSPELSFECLEKYKKRLESKRNKYIELRKEKNKEIEKELKDVEEAIGRVASIKIFLDNYIKKEEAKEEAEKLIAEAKDIIVNARHEREKNNLVKLLKDKKLNELELLLKAASENDINMVVTLVKLESFKGEYNLREGSEVLKQFNTVKEELEKESKEQLNFIAKTQRYKESIKLNNEKVEVENNEEDGNFEEINADTVKYHDNQDL